MSEDILKFSCTVAKHVRALEEDPEIAVSVGFESAHRADGRRIRHGSLHQREARSIKADQSACSADPEITIGRLADGIDVSAEKASLSSPCIVDVLRHGSRTIECVRCNGEAETEEDSSKPAERPAPVDRSTRGDIRSSQ